MSDYGKQWERIRKLREQIKAAYPAVSTASLDEAKRDAERYTTTVKGVQESRKTGLHDLITKWDRLETEIARSSRAEE